MIRRWAWAPSRLHADVPREAVLAKGRRVSPRGRRESLTPPPQAVLLRSRAWRAPRGHGSDGALAGRPEGTPSAPPPPPPRPLKGPGGHLRRLVSRPAEISGAMHVCRRWSGWCPPAALVLLAVGTVEGPRERGRSRRKAAPGTGARRPGAVGPPGTGAGRKRSPEAGWHRG